MLGDYIAHRALFNTRRFLDSALHRSVAANH
jgi:hypothetical protein